MFDPTTLLLLAALAAPPPDGYTPTANDSVLASVIAPLIKPRDQVRVHTGFGVVQGAAGWMGPEGLQVHTEAADIWSQPHTSALTWSQIERIDLHTQAAANAAKFGASAGCLLGLAMTAAALSYSGAYGETRVGAGGVVFTFVAGGVVGGVMGGLAGGIIGSVFPAWKTVYERR